MNFPHFLRIERDESGRAVSDSEAAAVTGASVEKSNGTRHFVVHLVEPRLALELAPDLSAPDKIGRGVIKRVCFPNSWAGDYGRYEKLISAAQEFFEQSRALPSPEKSDGRSRG